jgi:hypothetical protein
MLNPKVAVLACLAVMCKRMWYSASCGSQGFLCRRETPTYASKREKGGGGGKERVEREGGQEREGERGGVGGERESERERECARAHVYACVCFWVGGDFFFLTL